MRWLCSLLFSALSIVELFLRRKKEREREREREIPTRPSLVFPNLRAKALVLFQLSNYFISLSLSLSLSKGAP